MNNLYSSLEEQYQLPSGILSAVRKVESGGDSKAESSKGAKGDFQFMPETAKAYAVDISDPVSSAHGAAKYLSDLVKQYGSIQAALAHYNGGTKSGKAVSEGKDAPYQETRDYLNKVNSNLRIDPSQISWEGEKIEPSNVKWDEPKIEKSQVKWDESKKEEPSSLAQFAKGVGKSVTDTAMGAKQLLDIPAQFLEKQLGNSAVAKFGADMGMPTAQQSAEQTQKDIEQERIASKDLMQSTPGMLGYMAGNIGQTLAGGAALKGAGAVGAGSALMNPQTYKAAAGVGALQGALQPTLQEENKAFNIAAGAGLGAAGLGIVNALGRVAQPVQNQIGEIANNAVDTLKKAGIPLDAAQATGSKMLERVKAALNDNPITAGAQHEFSGVQKQAYNKAIAKTMGEDASSITPEVIQQAKTRLGANYDDIASRNSIHLDKELQTNLNAIRTEAEQTLVDPNQFKAIDRQLQNIISKAEEQGGGLHGEQYQSVKKVLDKLGKSKDTDVAGYAREIKDALLDGLTRTTKKFGNEKDVALLKETNKQYGNMKKIEDIALKDPEGNVSPSLLYNSLATKGKRWSFYQDDPQLAKLAAAGKIILPEKVPNSGTTSRLLAQAIPAAVGGAAYGAYEGDWGGAAKGAAGGYLAPKLAQKALNNPGFARYLEQGLAPSVIRGGLETPKQINLSKIPTAAYAAYLQSLQPNQGTKLSDIPRIEINGVPGNKEK